MMNSLLEISIFDISNVDSVTFYGYRKAQLSIRLISLYRHDERVERLEKFLYEKAGVKSKDNHTVFEVEYQGNKLALQFTDRYMWIGLGVIDRPW